MEWSSRRLYDGNMWISAQRMLGDQLYAISWFVFILAGIFPYLQLLSLAFIAVSSLGLMRRDWMLKWIAGLGRWPPRVQIDRHVYGSITMRIFITVGRRPPPKAQAGACGGGRGL